MDLYRTLREAQVAVVSQRLVVEAAHHYLLSYRLPAVHRLLFRFGAPDGLFGYLLPAVLLPEDIVFQPMLVAAGPPFLPLNRALLTFSE